MSREEVSPEEMMSVAKNMAKGQGVQGGLSQQRQATTTDDLMCAMHHLAECYAICAHSAKVALTRRDDNMGTLEIATCLFSQSLLFPRILMHLDTRSTSHSLLASFALSSKEQQQRQ